MDHKREDRAPPLEMGVGIQQQQGGEVEEGGR